jgi:hypothetical protein
LFAGGSTVFISFALYQQFVEVLGAASISPSMNYHLNYEDAWFPYKQ